MDRFTAIADPVRRQVLELLADRPRPAGRVAAAFAHLSRPAVSRHLRVLREAGLVEAELVGRERIYRVRPAPLGEVRAWLDRVGAEARSSAGTDHGAEAAGDGAEAWAARLDALETEVHRTRRERAHRARATPPGPPPQEQTA